eukprot:RCo006869
MVVGLALGGKLVVLRDGHLGVEQPAVRGLVVGMHHQHHLLDARANRLLHDDQHRRLAEPVPVHDGKHPRPRDIGRKEVALVPRHRHHRLPHRERRAQGQWETRQPKLTGDGIDQPLLVFGRPGKKLSAAVPLRANAFATEGEGRQGRVFEHLVQHGGRELRGAGRDEVFVKAGLVFHQQLPHPGQVPRGQREAHLLHQPCADRSQHLVHPRLHLVLGKWEAPVKLPQNFLGVLRGLQVDNYEVKLRPHRDDLGLQVVAIEGHQHAVLPKGAALVHPPTSGGSLNLSLVCQLHLPAHGQLDVVHPVEGPRHKNTHRSGGGQALLHRQVCLVVVDHQPPDLVVHHHAVRH